MKKHSTSDFIGLSLLALAALACSSTDDTKPGTINVQISGEEAATEGFLFPTGSEVTFVDGWELHFSHVLVTIADVTLSENPDKSPADQSQTDGAVARQTGPWAVDLAVPGSVPAAGGEGLATPLTTIANQNLHGSVAFETDRRYAFGYRIAVAEDDAERVNFGDDGAAETLYAGMIGKGYAVLYVGTATFKGTDCIASDSYDFGSLPTEVPFELGFATPTTYENCQNQENQGAAFEGEEYQRGVAVLPNRAATAQITLHMEHPFFSDTVHDSNLYFDQFAARLGASGSPDAALTLDGLADDDPTALTDGQGEALPWRVCPAGDGTADLPTGKQRGFGVGHILVEPMGNPRNVFRDYRDFVDYVQSTQGHLNGGEGLCYVAREYPSPQ
jgi:hypothetical protein